MSQDCQCNNSCSGITVVSDISNAYIQNLQGIFYKGQTLEITVSMQNNGYAILENSLDSQTTTFIRDTNISNFSSTPVRVNVYHCSQYDNNLTPSNNIATTNSLYCSYVTRNTNIYYGNNLQNLKGTRVSSFLVPANGNYPIVQGGYTNYVPGKGLVFEIVALDPTQTAEVIVNFGWWEQKNC